MDRMQAEQLALGQIDPGERLLWSGTPAPGVAAARALPASFIGIPFVAFACFWIWSAWSMTSRSAGMPWSLFPLFGIPFVVVGLGVMGAPLWTWLAAGKTVYALTDKRALIIVGGGVQSFAPSDINEISRSERADGTGSVFFASRTMTGSRGFTRQLRIGFEGIPEVRNVEHLIREHLQPKAA